MPDERCGIVPEDNDPEFVAQHLSAYAFMRPQIAGQRVLEIGVGDGYGAAYLAEAAHEMVGIDVTPGNIPWARAKYPKPNLTFQFCEGLRFPCEDGVFDAAGTFQVIEHLPEPQLLPWLREIHRVLKPGGRLYVSTLNLEHARKPGQPYHKLIYHEQEFTAPELEGLLRQVFPCVTLYGLHPTLTHRLFRRLKKWGLGAERYFRGMTTRDFMVTRSQVRRALDLIAVCEKP